MRHADANLAGDEVVQRQDARGLLRVLRLLLDVRRDGRVQASPQLERQPFVRRVAQQRPAEAQVAVALLVEELAQARPRRRVRRSAVLRRSSSHASIRGWNVRPNTAARRTSARSSGVSASIRAIAAASAESGSPPTPPDSMADRNRSRRNCGLPPDRCATTSSDMQRQRVLLGRELGDAQRVALRERLELDPRLIGCDVGAANPSAAGRRRRTISHGRRRQLAREVRKRARPTPRPCGARSRSRSSVVPGQHGRRGTRPPISCSFGAPVVLGQHLDLRRRRRLRRRTRWRSAAATARGRATRSDDLAAQAPLVTSSDSSRPIPTSSRSSSRHTAYGVDAVYASHTACRQSEARRLRRAAPRAAASCRCRPRPTISISASGARRALASASRNRRELGIAPGQRQRLQRDRAACANRRRVPTDHACDRLRPCP